MPDTRFAAAWLALREPADAAARDTPALAAVAAACTTAAARADDGRLAVTDLACGTGANVRVLLPRLPSPQRWVCADADPVLLAALPDAMARWAPSQACRATLGSGEVEVAGATTAARVEVRPVDLTSPGALDALVDGRHLVTASALLDLVSADWLEALLRQCRAAGTAVHFALTYDGRLACTPPDTDDGLVRALVNRHQHGDKGFGPALGPDASAAAAASLTRLGYQVRTDASDWRLGPDAGALQRALVDGWAAAAADIPGADRRTVGDWHARRLAHIGAGRSTLTVGHQDVTAWLP
jgi:hypothetical protein